MRRFCCFFVCLVTVFAVSARANGIPSEIFQNGKVRYEKSSNTLILEDGFRYSQGKGLVVFDTGKELHILLKGNAEFRAALVSKDDVVIDSEGAHTLAITSNISGSALQCPSLTVNRNVELQLLSRNSQDGMHALDCGLLIVNGALFRAETTTANLCVKVQELQLHDAVLEKPKGGLVSDQWGGVCYGDGLPAKIVRIKPEIKP